MVDGLHIGNYVRYIYIKRVTQQIKVTTHTILVDFKIIIISNRKQSLLAKMQHINVSQKLHIMPLVQVMSFLPPVLYSVFYDQHQWRDIDEVLQGVSTIE